MYRCFTVFFLFIVVLFVPGQSQSVKYRGSDEYISVQTQQIFAQYFQNSNRFTQFSRSGNQMFPTFELLRTDPDGLSRLFSIPSINNVFERIPMQYSDISVKNEEAPINENISNGFGYIEYSKFIKKWLGFGIGIGQHNYRSRTSSFFRGTSNQNEEVVLDFNNQQSASAIFSNLLLQVQSPYLFQKVSVYLQAGISLKYTYTASFKEEITLSYQESISSYIGNYKSNRKVFNTDMILPTIGISYLLENDISLNAFTQIRHRTPILNLDYNPFSSFLYGLGVSIPID